MTILLIIIHVLVCIALIMIVLLQTGKGADMGAAFGGGGSGTLFGSSGASTFLSKATTVAAVVFMLTSLSLAYLSSHRGSGSVMSEIPVASEPALPLETTGDEPATGGAAPTAEQPATGTAAGSSGDAATDTATQE